MKVRFLKDCKVKGEPVKEGDEKPFENEFAAKLIKRGLAEDASRKRGGPVSPAK